MSPDFFCLATKLPNWELLAPIRFIMWLPDCYYFGCCSFRCCFCCPNSKDYFTIYSICLPVEVYYGVAIAFFTSMGSLESETARFSSLPAGLNCSKLELLLLLSLLKGNGYCLSKLSLLVWANFYPPLNLCCSDCIRGDLAKDFGSEYYYLVSECSLEAPS